MLTTGKKALVLSGGGGRGAYHVGVLEFLEEHDWQPDIVVGTSIGAVNGAAIASGHNAHSLKSLWKRLKSEHVQKFNINPLSLTSLLDTKPLRKTLMQGGWIDFNRVNDASPIIDLRITATEITTGQLHVFGNSEDARKSDMIQEKITLDHLLSSCSIPMVYPATMLNNNIYWDGAIMANTPLGAAIDAGASEIVVVIMTPNAEGGSMVGHMPTNLISAVSMMLDWVLMSSFQAEMRVFRNVNKWLQLQDELDEIKGLTTDKKGKVYVNEPIIVSPDTFLPVNQIITYDDDGHDKLFRMGYGDAKRAWREAGNVVEGEG